VGVDQQRDYRSRRDARVRRHRSGHAQHRPRQARTAITPRTKAIIPVYLSGLPVDMDRLYAIARAHNLRVIEDAAQALGSTWKGQRIGAIGDIVSFSFHANKNLTTIEGGALVLNDEDEAALAQKYRLQGITRTGFDGMD
jgi:dTDP-4-amino-4,6-dideoxygalactose transaminase